MKIRKQPTGGESHPHLQKNDIQIGINVYVISLNQNGIVLSKPNNKNIVQVQIGNIKTNAKLDDLQIINIPTENITSYPSSQKSMALINSKSKSISTEINIIGMTTDEAIPIVDKYLDDAYLSSLKNVRIVHGKGTGKLREAVHTFLRKNSHIKSFRMGTFGEGEMGVTIVELKNRNKK